MPLATIGSHRLEKERGTALKAREAHLALAVAFGPAGAWLTTAIALGVLALSLGDGADAATAQWSAWVGCLALMLEGFSEGGTRTNRAGAEVVRDLGLVVWLLVAGLVPALALRRALGGMQPAATLLVGGWVFVVLYRALRARVLARAGLRDNLGLPLGMGAATVLALSTAAVAEHAGTSSLKAVAMTVAAMGALVGLPVRWRVFRAFHWKTRAITLVSWALVVGWHAWRGGPAVTALAVFLSVTVGAGMLEELLFHRMPSSEARPRRHAQSLVLPTTATLEGLLEPAEASMEPLPVDDAAIVPPTPAPLPSPYDDPIFTEVTSVH